MMIRGIQILIYLYRAAARYLSPPAACRFSPTCSQYAEQAFAKYGLIQGGKKVLARLLRCHPAHPIQIDPLV